MISTPIPEQLGGKLDVRIGDHNIADAFLNFGNRGKRVSWLVETVQSQSDGFKKIDGPIGGDTGYELKDYVAKLQFDSDPTATLYQSLRFKAGFAEQTSDTTYLGLTSEDFGIDPLRRYAASEGDEFVSEHKQYQLSYGFDPGNSWRGSVTAYRNDFERNWYKLQSVNGTGMSTVLDNPLEFLNELAWLKGATSPDDAITKRANNRSYYSQGLQASLEWDFGFGDTEVALTAGIRIHEDEEDRFQHEDGYRMENGALLLTTAAAPGSKTNRVSSADVTSFFVDTNRWPKSMALTVMLIVSSSVSAPPPVLPWSSVWIRRVATPLNPRSGVKTKPSKALLMSAWVPVNTIVVSSKPSPTLKVKWSRP